MKERDWRSTPCVMCEEPITNPICPACLQEGVRQWLLEQRQGQLAAEVRALTSVIFANHGDVFCIKCDSAMALCAYCYTKEVFNVIKDHQHLVKQYLAYFNYDLQHLGWEQDARAYTDDMI
jgi:hypothetical protein